MANGHGGARKGSGRKSKADEQKIRKLGIDSMKKIYGSEAKFFQHIAQESKESFPHLKLFMEYCYGKPKETVEVQGIELKGITFNE